MYVPTSLMSFLLQSENVEVAADNYDPSHPTFLFEYIYEAPSTMTLQEEYYHTVWQALLGLKKVSAIETLIVL